VGDADGIKGLRHPTAEDNGIAWNGVVQQRSSGMDEKFFRNIDGALGKWLNKELQEPPKFGGEPGEPVPEVDPDDLRAVWEQGRDLQVRHPGQHVATGLYALQSICKPGADIRVVAYRASMLSLITTFAAEHLAPWTKEGQLDEAVFHAAAKVRMEWMGVGIIRQDFPVDMDGFLRLCSGKSKASDD
jgi:hypothetical protein